ncbi:hypothetical protein [Phenylobacterium sp. SCN 70-31]|uniref:hypothetical protein n=1 Tax=Phenylobacterium sp. SCN 70-31 TaxID=1660129 RepID=UPI00086C3E5E|nr:hypothetical protein [Phenylobacterium sp. SCN 70-31]ODT83922.1 MAG: hypothetical protein ABS78_22995 [Phenylobacterium sp. SCN 70-31]
MTPEAAIAARRLALATALHDVPEIRAALSYAQILNAVDVAMKAAAIPELVGAVVAAAAVTAAVQADVVTPPSSVTDALAGYDLALDPALQTWGYFLPI